MEIIPDFKIIEVQCYNESQSWYYVCIYRAKSRTFRISIRRNAYDEQSWAKVELFDGHRWNKIHDEPIQCCEASWISYVNKDIQPVDFEADFNRLMALADEILQ